MKILAIILALLIPQMALARIGETKEQCDERYGKPIKVSDDGHERNYKKGDIAIKVIIWRGVAHEILYEVTSRVVTQLDGESVDEYANRIRSANYLNAVSEESTKILKILDALKKKNDSRKWFNVWLDPHLSPVNQVRYGKLMYEKSYDGKYLAYSKTITDGGSFRYQMQIIIVEYKTHMEKLKEQAEKAESKKTTEGF